MLAISALSLTLFAAPGDAPMTLLTDHGVELVADEQVFLLFAALNGAGYAEEPRRKGPPLNAPVFHPIREDVRDALRSARSSASMQAVRKVFEENNQPIAVYIAAALSRAPDAKSKPSGAAASLADKLAPLSDFRGEANMEAVFDKVALEQRKHMKTLKATLEKDFAVVLKVLGSDAFRTPRNLVVVPNPLDGHGLVRELEMGDKTYLVVGPGEDGARAAILEAALRPTVTKMVNASYGRAAKLARSWSTLKTSKRITKQWPNGKAYLSEALTNALAHRAMAGGSTSRDADEEFIDEQARDGMRWARTALRVLDAHGSGALAEALPKLLSKANP